MLFYLVATAALIPSSEATFGGCCAVAPPPCPTPVCAPAAPPPLPCPPPPICPPQFCPPPPVCPPPPPPPPPPLCPPPLPAYQPPCQSYAPPPVFQTYVQPQAVDCCCRCGVPCRYRNRHKTHGSKIFSANSIEEEMEATCNSKKLKTIIEDNLTTDPTISKRAIQKAAEEKLFGKFNVICAEGDFTYIAYTETYCQASNDDITCYAFKSL